MIKVFISYSWDSSDHKKKVLALSNKLRKDGVDCHIDQYETSPPENWPKWMERQIKNADFVLIISTETYYNRVMGIEQSGKGKGVRWESLLIYQHHYDDDSLNKRFIPVVFNSSDESFIPTPLKGSSYYRIDSQEGYGKLYRRLTGQPDIVKPDLGKVKDMPPQALPDIPW